jgi:hypothetical protein
MLIKFIKKLFVNLIFFHVFYSVSSKVAMAGDYVLSLASMMLSRLRNDDVTIVLSNVSICGCGWAILIYLLVY